MSLLTDIAPESVMIDGTRYEIDADFRNCIKFEELLRDPDLNNEEKFVLALNLFYPKIPENAQAAFEKILWFYSANAQVEKSAGTPSRKKIYSLNHDADYIFAAFLADYGIDLNSISYLHWWKFLALFAGLKPDNLMCKIMEFRATNTSELKGKEKKHYEKMQKIYAIPESRGDTERNNAIAEALMAGENIDALLRG